MKLNEAKDALRRNAKAIANEYTLDTSEAFKEKTLTLLGGELQGIVVGLNLAGALNELSSAEYVELVKYVSVLVDEARKLAGFEVYTDEEREADYLESDAFFEGV